MDLLLNCYQLSKTFGARPLFENISAGFFDDTRLGLIGPNGAGKSTFLKILAGLETSDSGEVALKKDCRLCYLGQSDYFRPGLTVEDVLYSGLSNEEMDDDERHIRVQCALSETGFSNGDAEATTLSGGWQKRLSIAVALSRKPDLLLLDEPTNHLDIEGVIWLEKFLLNASFAYVVVSHDRYFLSNAVKQVMELNRCYPGGYFLVKGNYEEFLSKKIDFLESQAAYENSLNSRLKLENAWLQRGARARSTKAKFRVEEAGRLQEEFSAVSERNRTPKAAGINFNATGRKTKKLLWAENINKKMGDKALFSLPGLQLRPGNCVGILGPNGSGKTTLLRVLSGSVAADSGMVETADGLKMVVFEQDRSSLNLDETLKEALCPLGDSVCFRGVEVHYAAWAARFLFEKEQLRMPVRNLSGGEQARILIARMMLEAADVLFLDEPTNDLDISTLEMLEQNLEDFPGAIVLVTHDRRMLDRLATEVIGLDGDGNAAVYADFLQWYQKRRARQNNNQSGVKAGHKPAAGRRKKLSFHQQKELDGMEELVLQAEVELDEIKKQLQSEFVLQNPDKLQELCTALPLKQQEVDDLYERWNELEQLQAGLK